MSLQHFKQVVGRALTDENFARMLLRDAPAALSEYDLSEAEQKALTEVAWTRHRSTEGDEPSLEFSAAEPKQFDVELMFDMFEDKEWVQHTYLPFAQKLAQLKGSDGSGAPEKTMPGGFGYAGPFDHNTKFSPAAGDKSGRPTDRIRLPGSLLRALLGI